MSFTSELIKKYATEAERIYNARTAGDFTWDGLLFEFMRELEAPQQYHVVTADGWVMLYSEEYDSWAALGEVEWYDDEDTRKDTTIWTPHTARGSIYKGFEAGLDKMIAEGGIAS